MKVLSLVPYTIFPARTGGQKGIALFNKYFAQHCDMICVTVKSNGAGPGEGYLVLNIIGNSRFRYINPLYIFTLRRIIRRYGITHLVLEHPYFGWLGILLKKITGIRLVVHSHNIEATRWKSLDKWWWKMLYRYERTTHRHSDYNFFIQEADRQYAIKEYGLSPERCIVVTYGIEWETAPTREECLHIQTQIKQQHGIAANERLLLFNGAFAYRPNLDALNALINNIDPLLQQQEGFHYKILICGIGIPPDIGNRSYRNIIIAGFAEDISRYFKAADVFLNPIIDGGGIKTKLVEALGYNVNAVSTASGANGVPPELCNGKLFINADNDWKGFTAQIIAAADIRADISPAYFDHFAWNKIAGKAAGFIQE